MSARIAEADACARGTTETMRPAKMVTTTSARSRTSSSSVDEKITAVPLRAVSRMRLWISARPPTSTPRVGSSRASSAVPSSCIARLEQHLLLVAAAEALGGEAEPVEGNGRHGCELAGAPLDTAPEEDSEPAQPPEPRDRQVALDRLPEEEALALAVVRDVEDARGGCAPRRVQEHLSAADLDRAGGIRDEPAEGTEDGARAGPHLPGEPGDDPALEREGQLLDAPGDVEPVDLDHLLAGAGRRVLVLDLRLRPFHLAEHVLDQGAPVDRADLVRADAHPVSEHGHAIAQLEDLVEPVRHEDDAALLRDELARRPEHALDLRLAQGRGRLVQDEQASVAHEQAGDLDELTLADRERLDRGAELHVAEPELVEDAPSLLGEPPPPVEQRNVEPSEEDVVLDAELRDEAQLLVHERDPVPLRLVRVTERELAAVEPDRPFVGPDEADEALHEGALARRRCGRRSRAPRRPGRRAKGLEPP